MADDPAKLAARIGELERRMDQVMDRIGYLPGEAPIRHDPAKWEVSDEVLAIASSGKDKDIAKAVLAHIKETGAEPEPARQAVLTALGKDSGG